MILFVDVEHKSAHDKPWGEFLLASRTRITYRLQQLAGDVCLLQHYTNVHHGLIDDLGIRAVFLSGSSTDPDQYGPEGLDEMRDIVRSQSVPLFGFCGGFQLMMEALGSEIVRIGPLSDGEEKQDPEYMPGWRTETGYLPVSHSGGHPLLNSIGPEPVFRHYHGWEIRDLPSGFVNYARTGVTQNQLVVNDRTFQVGTQFHPEYFTDEHPAGGQLIENFCRWAGLLS